MRVPSRKVGGLAPVSDFFPCSGPGEDGLPCGRRVVAKGLCAGHYQQVRHGRRLSPLQTAKGTATEIKIRCDLGLRTAMAVEAEREGITEREAWRRAARWWLERPRAK